MPNMGEIPATYEALLVAYQSQQAQIFLLTEELAQLKRLITGARSERFVPVDTMSQLALGLIPEPDETAAAVETEEVTYTRHKSKPKYTPHGRNPIPAHILRKEIIIEPAEDTASMKRIGEEITEELDYEPGKLYVNRYVRPKYARVSGNGVVIGTLPTRPIEKGIAGAGLLAHLAISKYVDHLPLYRLRKQFLREDVKLPASTLGDWISSICELLMPLYELERALIQKTDYLMVDETPIRVQDPDTKGKCHKGYYWVYFDPLGRRVLFDYRDSRNRAGPEEMLNDFSGFLQTDGYGGYDAFGRRDSITHAACFAHARRYFTDALPTDNTRAEWMLLRIQQLYASERQAREASFTPQQRLELRQQEALPVLAQIKAWLEVNRQQVLPKSDIGKAVAYMLK